MATPLLIVLIVLRACVVYCGVCDTELARDSYGCCLYESHLHTDCQYLQGECQAGEGWATGEEFCDQFSSIKITSPYQLLCKGVRNPFNGSLSLDSEEDVSTYDNNTFLWTCSKQQQQPLPQQPTIILDPPAGVISTHTQIFPLAVTLATGFPKARSMLFTPDSVTGVTCDNEDTNTDLTGLVTTSCSYQVRLLTQETRLSLVVLQEGFKNKTFQYRVTSTAFPDNTGGQNTIHSSCFIFIIFCYYIIINQ